VGGVPVNYATAFRKGLQRAENAAEGRRERLFHRLQASLERFGEVIAEHYRLPFGIRKADGGFELYFGAWGFGRIAWNVDVSEDLEMRIEDYAHGDVLTSNLEELEEFLAEMLEQPEFHDRLRRTKGYWDAYPNLHNIDTYYPLPPEPQEQENKQEDKQEDKEI
jgi:hypothetical protein